ncbi:MAG TPA: hypothetical protein DCQ32_02680 [Cyanobacteria bacterium UBA8156]|jgi:hypothetical protein|nr:hypothetical protein [Cyanobacteria bacterium UBA8156]
MNKFDPTKLQTKFDNTQEGWLVQIYSGNRRLLCVIDSSHAWSFLIGCGLGLLFAVGWYNLARYSQSMSSEPTTAPTTNLPGMWID